MAAARPFGPAPTTIASTGPSLPELTSPSRGAGRWRSRSPASGDRADRCRHRPSRRPKRRAVADIAPMAPLPVAVDARRLHVDHWLAHADHEREAVQRRQPELVVLAISHELVGDLVERVGR